MVCDIDRERRTLITESERIYRILSSRLTFVPRIIGPGKVPPARVALMKVPVLAQAFDRDRVILTGG